MLTDRFRSESFFLYNDIISLNSNLYHHPVQWLICELLYSRATSTCPPFLLLWIIFMSSRWLFQLHHKNFLMEKFSPVVNNTIFSYVGIRTNCIQIHERNSCRDYQNNSSSRLRVSSIFHLPTLLPSIYLSSHGKYFLWNIIIIHNFKFETVFYEMEIMYTNDLGVDNIILCM